MAKNGRRFSPWLLVGVAVVAIVLFGVGGGLISAFEGCIVNPYTTVCNYVRAPLQRVIKNDSFSFDFLTLAHVAFVQDMANYMAFLGHLLRGPWIPLARITLFFLLVRSLDHIPRITATSSCSVQPRNRIREWGEFWRRAATTTTTATATLHPITAILRRTSPVPSTCCTCCAFKGSIHYYSTLTAKCACAAVPSCGIRIHTSTSATTAYQ